MPRHPGAASCLLLLLTSLAGCASTPPERAPEQVAALVGCLDRVEASAAEAADAVAMASKRLQELLATKAEQEEAFAAYARFVQAIDGGEQSVRHFGDQLRPLQAAGEQVFARWRRDLAAMQNERLRQRSELRLAESRDRFAAVLSAASAGRQQAQAHLRTLRDHALFFAHDLNPSALAAAADEADRVVKATGELGRSLAECRAAARAYIEQATMAGSMSAGLAGNQPGVAEQSSAPAGEAAAPAPPAVIR